MRRNMPLISAWPSTLNYQYAIMSLMPVKGERCQPGPFSRDETGKIDSAVRWVQALWEIAPASRLEKILSVACSNTLICICQISLKIPLNDYHDYKCQ